MNVEIWAYCLMPNHVHLIAVPHDTAGLSRAIGEAHRRYTRHINFRESWRGYLWQGRFASFVMDERHCLCAARYIELNPVKAKLCKKAENYKFSSAVAHLSGKDDALVKSATLNDLVGDWQLFLSQQDDDGEEALERHERTGRPIGDSLFLNSLEAKLGRNLSLGKPGRPKKK
jgi:putative transposase